MRQTILNRTPFFGNDDEYADAIAVKVFDDLYDAIEGKPNTKGESSRFNRLGRKRWFSNVPPLFTWSSLPNDLITADGPCVSAPLLPSKYSMICMMLLKANRIRKGSVFT